MKALRLAALPFVLLVLSGAALLVPAVAQAAPIVMTLSSHDFPGGSPAPDGVSGRVLVTPGSVVALTAPSYLYEPAAPPATSPTVYEFMFWDVNATLRRTATAIITAPTGAPSFNATAWYLPVGGGGGGASAVTTYAFSLNTYQVLAGSPIQSVSPAIAWTSPSASVSTATAVTITPLDPLVPGTKLSSTAFRSWFVFGGTGVTKSGNNVTVPAGESPYAIAFYYQTGMPPTPPCKTPKCI